MSSFNNIISLTQANYAAYQLNNDGVIGTPTDTIYGLSALANKKAGALKLIKLKKRIDSKGLILLCSDIAFALPYIASLTSKQYAKLQEKTQQPTTYLIPKADNTPNYITGNFKTVALRITTHPMIVFLCEKTQQALLSSSANLSGFNATNNRLKLQYYFGNELDAILPPEKDSKTPSTIKDLITGQCYR